MTKKKELDVQRLIALYSQGISSIKIGKLLNVSDSFIRSKLKENGIKIRSLRDSHKTKIFNEDYFETIDSAEKAYWLGFIYADGNIRINTHKRGYKSYIISIAQAESEPLEKLIKAINGNNIRLTTHMSHLNKIYYTLTLNSKTMFDGLNSNGCVPNKSLILKFPSNVPENLNNHFIRGYFDGDGSIFIRKMKKVYKNHIAIYQNGVVSFIGTFEFLSKIKEILNFIPTHLIKNKRRDTNNWELRATSYRSTEEMYKYFYENVDSSIILQRKKDKFEQIIREKGSTTIIGSPIKTPVWFNKNRIKG